MVVKQERTGRLKWLKELRETEWHPYVKQFLVREANRKRLHPENPDSQQTITDTVYDTLDMLWGLGQIIHEELEGLCFSAKVAYDTRHEHVDGSRLQWEYTSCSTKNCGTCFNKLDFHYPYPKTVPRGSSKGERQSVRREKLARFLVEDCGFLPDQVAILFDLRDLRHLLIRHFHYLVLQFRNLGYRIDLEYEIP